MRDFIRHEAEFRDRTHAFPKLRRILQNWFARRQLRSLAELDDYLLNDIGLTRDDLRYGMSVAHDVDPIAEVMAARDHRLSRGARHQ